MKVLVLFDLPRPVGPDETFSNRALREEEDRATEADVISALGKLGHQVETLAVYDDALAVVKKVQDRAPDVVFNLCESFFNERCKARTCYQVHDREGNNPCEFCVWVRRVTSDTAPGEL
jgi:hypothetical protein